MSNTQEKLEKILKAYAEDRPAAVKAILQLMGSAKLKARIEGYKKGYIDAGIKEITEGASKDLFQELLLYKAAYGELPLEQSGD